jgi:hypothetical protein
MVILDKCHDLSGEYELVTGKDLTYSQNGKVELGDFFLLSCFWVLVPQCKSSTRNR